MSATAEYLIDSAPAMPPCSRPRYTACFDARTDIGETLRISSAQRRAPAIASPSGTTSLTNPSS